MNFRSYSERTLQPGRTPGSGLQGARRKDPATGRRRGWAAEPSFRKSLRMGAPLEKGPGAAAGAFLISRGETAGSDGERLDPRCPDPLHLVWAEEAYSPADEAEHAAGEEEPGFRFHVQVEPEDALGLALADHAGEELVHGLHVLPHVLSELFVLCGFAEGLHPELRELVLAVARPDRAAAHLLQAGPHVGGVRDRLLPRAPSLRPHVVEDGEIEIALRREVAVEDRLGDACGARDLRRRRPAVAALGEDPDRRLDQLEPAFRRRQPRRGLHAAISAMCACST